MEDPVIAPNPAQAPMVASARPPRKCPSKACASRYMSADSPAVWAKAPISRNSGMISNMSLESRSMVRVATRLRAGPLSIITTVPAKPASSMTAPSGNIISAPSHMIAKNASAVASGVDGINHGRRSPRSNMAMAMMAIVQTPTSPKTHVRVFPPPATRHSAMKAADSRNVTTS